MLAAIFWFLVKAFFWVLFIGLLINIFSHWITTGESPAQILTDFIKHRSLERLESKQERCEHDWYDLTTKTKLKNWKCTNSPIVLWACVKPVMTKPFT